MSPFGLLRKGPRLSDPIPATALVVRGDPGYSASTWWTAALRLRVAAPGHAPVLVEHESRAVREKTPYTGLTLPVFVERHDPTQVRIRWDDVPTLEQRIAERYPPILAPRSAWRDVIDADPSQAEHRPDWGDGQVDGWPFGARLRRGRRAGTAIVIGHSWDPEPCRSGNDFLPPRPSPYRYGGKIRMNDQEFLGWMLLCVIPPEGDRYAVHLRTQIRRDRLAPVLPVAIRRSRPTEIEIAWDDAPQVRAAPEEPPAPDEPQAPQEPHAPEQEPEAKPPAAAVKVAEKPKPRRTTRKPAASKNGKPATPRPKKPSASTNGRAAAGKAKPRTRAQGDRTSASGRKG